MSSVEKDEGFQPTCFALDYDGTASRDIPMWADWIKRTVERGHAVAIVTMRTWEEAFVGTESFDPIDNRLSFEGVPIITTDRMPKRKHCEAIGVHIDVWIEDQPEAVHFPPNMWERVKSARW